MNLIFGFLLLWQVGISLVQLQHERPQCWSQYHLKEIFVAFNAYISGNMQTLKVASAQLTNHGSLFMDQHSKIFKNLVHFPNLLLDFLYPLISFFNNSLVEGNLIVKQQNLLSAAQITQELRGLDLMRIRSRVFYYTNYLPNVKK